MQSHKVTWAARLGEQLPKPPRIGMPHVHGYALAIEAAMGRSKIPRLVMAVVQEHKELQPACSKVPDGCSPTSCWQAGLSMHVIIHSLGPSRCAQSMFQAHLVDAVVRHLEVLSDRHLMGFGFSTRGVIMCTQWK